jgi:hypothetical protein
MSDYPALSAIAAKRQVPIKFWLIAVMFPALFVSAIAQVGAMRRRLPLVRRHRWGRPAGKARMTVFNTGPNAMTMDFNPGDIG